MTNSSYLDIAAQKREERDSKFIKDWLIPVEDLPDKSIKNVIDWPVKSGYLSRKEIEITESSIVEIQSKIKSRELTAYDVALAFCHRASIANQLVNCLSEVFFEEGLESAKELDRYYQNTGELKGPLHGIPISLKDNLNVKGQATSIGFVGFANNPKRFEEDTVIVKMWRDMGAVFCFKTNVPVAMMMPESTNHIFGNTVNPFNRDLTSGGSSGGEAALGALLGSCYVGIGSDIGGSLRIPAAMQNLFTLRPSSGRFPTFGARSGLPGLESVNSVNGPLTTRWENLKLYCETLVNEGKPWNHDPKCLEIPWREVKLPEKLTFAVLRDDFVVKPYPAITRGLDLAIEKLKKNGHEIIEWKPLHHQRLADIITTFFLSDGGFHCKEYAALTGEPFFPYMEMYDTCKELGVSELWDLQAERTKLCKEYLEQWNATAKITKSGNSIDAIIMPVSPYSGVYTGKFRYVGYTSVFNALDWAAGVIPYTTADKVIDAKDATYEPRNEIDEDTFANYDANEIHGGPVSLQIVCKKLQEEKLVELMKVISKQIGSFDYWDKKITA